MKISTAKKRAALTDRDQIIQHIDNLRAELLKEFRQRRIHVDAELRNLHEKLDARTRDRDTEIKAIYEELAKQAREVEKRDRALRGELQPLLLAGAGQREVRRALVGAVTLLVTIGGLVIGAAHLVLRWINGA